MAKINTYFKGSTAKLWCDFSVAGVPTDPDTVTFKTVAPSGALHAYNYPGEILKSTTGKYHIHINLEEKGKLKYRLEGAGSCAAVYEGYLQVTSDF